MSPIEFEAEAAESKMKSENSMKVINNKIQDSRRKYLVENSWKFMYIWLCLCD